MPALKNVRYEKFCENIATSPKTGLSQGRCYVEAGYKTNGRSADACAARMLTRDNIKARIAELIEPAVRKTRTTIDSLTEQFDRVFDGAVTAEQYGAASNAAGLKAKLLGFMKTQIEIGAPGEFGACQSVPDVIAALLSSQSPAEALAGLDTLRAEIEAYAADHAHVIAAEPARRRPDEAALSLAALRPGRR